EIVSRPDMRSPAEAGAYLRKLRSILRYVGSCDGNMEEGSMRADVNVSVRKPGGELGTRTETKNVNSVRFVMAVVEHEARREVETAGWFDALIDNDVDPKQAANWTVAELFGALNRLGKTMAESPVSPAHAAQLLKLVADGTISGTIAKQVFEIMLDSGEPPSK